MRAAWPAAVMRPVGAAAVRAVLPQPRQAVAQQGEVVVAQAAPQARLAALGAPPLGVAAPAGAAGSPGAAGPAAAPAERSEGAEPTVGGGG
jgi:hypothetical protein